MLMSTVPVLLVRDVQASAAWYHDKLGFNFNRFWGEPPGFVILWLDAIEIMLRQCPDGVRPHREVAPGMWDAYLRVRDVEALRQELSEREVAIERGPERMSYGCTEIEVVDPDGYALCFGQCD
jgi:catechol 2,3-dioxygenase-like lactoylglutathione lyase family enzyme